MDTFSSWGPYLILGMFFTPFGALKLYGFCRGYEGGPGKGPWERLRAGSCAEEHSAIAPRWRLPFFLALDVYFLAMGLFCLFRAYHAVNPS